MILIPSPPPPPPSSLPYQDTSDTTVGIKDALNYDFGQTMIVKDVGDIHITEFEVTSSTDL